MAGVLSLLVEYAWVVPLQRNPGGAQESGVPAAERGRGSQNGLAWRGPFFSFGFACSSVRFHRLLATYSCL